MSDKEWGKEALFDAPHARELAEKIKIEQPVQVEHAAALPLPTPLDDATRAVLGNPHILEHVWRQPEPTEQLPEQKPNEIETAAAVAMSLSLLHSIHTQDQPGARHLRHGEREDEEEPSA
jgi:hypothetical protein